MAGPNAAGSLVATREGMTRVLVAMDRDLGRIQVGARASAALLDGLLVDNHGARKPLGHLAAVHVPDPHQIVIQPWDPADVRAIGSAIAASRIGLRASVDGPRLRLHVPSLTEARRQALVLVVKRRAEEARVEVRRVRHALLGTIRTAAGRDPDGARRQAEELDRLTAEFVAEIDRRAAAREAALLTLG